MRTRGFTLLELLVALAVFAVLSVMAYGALRTVLDARDHLAQEAARLKAVQTAFMSLERDVEQAAPREVRDTLGGELPAFSGGGQAVTLLALTRDGWRNPLNRPRSHLQRVDYVIEGGRLIRRSWTVLDQAPSSEPYNEVLLNGVESAQVRFLDTSRQWQSFWPQTPGGNGAAQSTPPRAVEVSFELQGWGRLTRLFRVPG